MTVIWWGLADGRGLRWWQGVAILALHRSQTPLGPMCCHCINVSINIDHKILTLFIHLLSCDIVCMEVQLSLFETFKINVDMHFECLSGLCRCWWSLLQIVLGFCCFGHSDGFFIFLNVSMFGACAVPQIAPQRTLKFSINRRNDRTQLLLYK